MRLKCGCRDHAPCKLEWPEPQIETAIGVERRMMDLAMAMQADSMVTPVEIIAAALRLAARLVLQSPVVLKQDEFLACARDTHQLLRSGCETDAGALERLNRTLVERQQAELPPPGGLLQ